MSEISSKKIKKVKVIAIASAGGHWSELMMLKDGFDLDEFTNVTYITTLKGLPEIYDLRQYFIVRDGNLQNFYGLFSAAVKIYKFTREIRPDFVISTGAAPGVIGIVIGKVFSAKTIWIDSIANPKKLSLSCRLVTPFCSRIYTQWEELSNKKVKYKGSLF